MLELINVDVFYGRVRTLKNISLKVSTGEIVTLIGSNGAGKSTTLNCISGIVRAASGEIRFNDRRIDRVSPYAIVEMGITQVPEERRIFAGMNVEENLRVGAHTVKNSKAIIDRMEGVMQTFPILRTRRYQMGGTLSGGEQQMLAIGRGLMTAPKLLLMDEPSLGLAPLIVKEVASVIKEINKNGQTILLVEQNAIMALHLAARGYVFVTGSITLEDTSEKLLNNDDVRRAYLGA